MSANTPPRVVPANREPDKEPAVDAKPVPLPRGYSRELKLLYLEQTFRHEARFLNEDLKRDRGLAYQGFFLDAQDGWTQPTSGWSEDATKRVKPLLYPFYADGKIVREEKDFVAQKYDVLIIGDVDPASTFWRIEYWDWIADWVDAGGGLILLSGPAHHPSDYLQYKAYRELCPVYLDLPEGEAVSVNRGLSKYYARTEEGRSHEIMRLCEEENRNDELFGTEVDGKFQAGALHGLYSYQVTHKARAGATTLARVGFDGEPVGESQPLIVTRQYGEGRVLWLGTDDFHYWRQYVGDFYFARFWQNCIRWAANDPGRKPD
jgi:hypothetical protein